MLSVEIKHCLKVNTKVCFINFNDILTVTITVKVVVKTIDFKLFILMKLAKNLKQDIVLKVKQSDTFKNAPTSMALLQYLFDATSTGEQLKESIIDIEFFGSNNTSDKTTPRVRVNVYNLRKK